MRVVAWSIAYWFIGIDSVVDDSDGIEIEVGFLHTGGWVIVRACACS